MHSLRRDVANDATVLVCGADATVGEDESHISSRFIYSNCERLHPSVSLSVFWDHV
jgi:hypothetical protein